MSELDPMSPEYEHQVVDNFRQLRAEVAAKLASGEMTTDEADAFWGDLLDVQKYREDEA